jgi:hypothetical protein
MNQRRQRIWTATTAAWVATLVAAYLSGFTLTSNSWLIFCMSAAVLALAPRVNPNAIGKLAAVGRAADAFLLIAIISMLGAVASYVAMSHSGPLTDQLLADADSAIGFNWAQIRAATEQTPYLLDILDRAYWACTWLPLAIIGLLCGTDGGVRLYRFISAYGIALLTTVVIAGFFPAEAAFAYFGVVSKSDLAVGYIGVITALRDGSLTAIDLHALGGIITFPSFHATMAILFAWALWPFRKLRPAVLILNGLMWLAAVPIGGHYFVDLIAGSLTAVIGILLASRTRQAQPVKTGWVLARPLAARFVGHTKPDVIPHYEVPAARADLREHA